MILETSKSCFQQGAFSRNRRPDTQRTCHCPSGPEDRIRERGGSFSNYSRHRYRRPRHVEERGRGGTSIRACAPTETGRRVDRRYNRGRRPG